MTRTADNTDSTTHGAIAMGKNGSGPHLAVDEEVGKDLFGHLAHHVRITDEANGLQAYFSSTNGKATILGGIQRRRQDDGEYGDTVLRFGAYERQVGAPDFTDPREVALASIAAEKAKLQAQLQLLEAAGHYVQQLPAKHLVWREDPKVTALRYGMEQYTSYVLEHVGDKPDPKVPQYMAATLEQQARAAARKAVESVLPKRTARKTYDGIVDTITERYLNLRVVRPDLAGRDHLVAPAYVVTSKGLHGYGDSGDDRTVERTRVQVVRAENEAVACYVAKAMNGKRAGWHGTKLWQRWGANEAQLAPAGWDADDGVLYHQGDTTTVQRTATEVGTGRKVLVSADTSFQPLYK
jgi:hypothetical protein